MKSENAKYSKCPENQTRLKIVERWRLFYKKDVRYCADIMGDRMSWDKVGPALYHLCHFVIGVEGKRKANSAKLREIVDRMYQIKK